eukprot:8724448-Lingulodinium_polyedra.AAC.1
MGAGRTSAVLPSVTSTRLAGGVQTYLCRAFRLLPPNRWGPGWFLVHHAFHASAGVAHRTD